MSIFRFQQEQEFIRFLNDTKLLRGGKIEAVVRKGGTESPVEVVTAPLPDTDFETLTRQLAAYGARIAAGDHSTEAATRGLDMARYIESIRPRPIEGAGRPEQLTQEMLLMVEGGPGLFERARDQIFQFGCERGFRVMAAEQGGRDFFLLHLQGLRSHYPVLRWRAEPEFSFFVPLERNPGCFIRNGYHFPLRDLAAYHPSLGAVNLIGEDGWWWTSKTDSFHAIGDLCEVRLAGARAPVEIKAKPADGLPKFQVELRLEEEGGADRLAGAAEGAREGPDRAQRRLQELETERWRIDAEIDRLTHFTHAPPRVYWFGGPAIDTLVSFATRYPLEQVRKFVYYPLEAVGEPGAGHLVLPIDLAQPTYLPPEIAGRGRVFERHEDWFCRHGFQAFLPAGLQLVPPLEFSSADPLLRILGGSLEGHVFVLDGASGQEMTSYAVPMDALVPLESSVEYLNASVLVQEPDQGDQALKTSLQAKYEHSFGNARDHGRALGQHFAAELVEVLAHYQKEMESALLQLDDRKKALEEHVELLDTIEEFEKTLHRMRDKQLSSLGEFLDELGASLGQMVVETDRQEGRVLGKFRSVLGKIERLRARRADELEKFRAELETYLEDRDARRDALVAEIDAALEALSEESTVEGADEIAELLERAKAKLTK